MSENTNAVRELAEADRILRHAISVLRADGDEHGVANDLVRLLHYVGARETLAALAERDARGGEDAAAARVAKHMAMSIEYIEKQYPGARQLDAGPIMRNLRRWRDQLARAQAPETSR